MSSVYVATSLLNADQAKLVINRFREHGIEVTYDWTIHGQVFDDERLRQYGIEELDGVLRAELLFMMHPARSGTHVELGAALASNKPVVIVCDPSVERKTFYYVPNVSRFTLVDEAFEFALRKLKS